MADTLGTLIKKEGWDIISRKIQGSDGKEQEVKLVLCEGGEFPYTHPFSIHAKIYRTSRNPDERERHLWAMHDYCWPDAIKHEWTVRRFRAHCEGWKYLSMASGGSTGKSYDAAKLAWLFWQAKPNGRGVIVASTTLASLDGRIWGYLLKLAKTCQLKFKYKYMRSKPPHILYEPDNTLCGMFAIAAKRGDDDAAINTWIGRHPPDGLMVILDEGTDMPVALLKALPNLEKGQLGQFHVMIIGNSNSKYDLHGSLSTPKDGWDSIDKERDTRWETTQDNGICLYFNCYDSPAITDPDPEKREKLGKFLITLDQINKDIIKYGKDSIQFYRFTLGFWKDDSTESTVISRTFLTNFSHKDKVEWSPHATLKPVAGLDPAFSYGGDNCILRIGVLGLDINGQVLLDFRDTELLFYIRTLANSVDSIELQISKQVVEILNEFRIPLKDLAVDCSGQGRAFAEVIRLTANVIEQPIKLYSTQSYRIGRFQNIKQTPDIQLISSYELWIAVRRFIEGNSIRGLDAIAVNQLVTRLITEENGKVNLEKKDEYKKRMGAISPSLAQSPDEMDGVALCLQVAMRNYGFFPGQTVSQHLVEGYGVPHLSKINNQKIENRVEPVRMPEFGGGFSRDLSDIPKQMNPVAQEFLANTDLRHIFRFNK
jgi:hypothetical protein